MYPHGSQMMNPTFNLSSNLFFKSRTTNYIPIIPTGNIFPIFLLNKDGEHYICLTSTSEQ